MLDVYKIATLPKAPPEILGRRLVPLTLSAAELLGVFDNPFEPFSGHRNAEFSDLVQAVILCSYPNRPAALGNIQSGAFDAACVDLGARAPQLPGFSLQPAVDAMSAYISYWSQSPPRWKMSGQKLLAVPFEWALLQALEEVRNCTREELWELTVVDALCQFWVMKAMHGDESVKSEKDHLYDLDAEREADLAQLKEGMAHGRNG